MYDPNAVHVKDLNTHFNKETCCDHLLVSAPNNYDLPTFLCELHDRKIGYGDEGNIKAMMFCNQYKQNHNCWAEAAEKVEREQAEKERAEKAAKEKADIERIIAGNADAFKNNADDAQAYEKRGFDFLNEGYLDQGIADYGKAIQLKPNNAEAYKWRGMAYSQKGDFDKAIDDFTQFLKRAPDNADVYSFRGLAYSSKKDYSKAVADFNEAIRLDPQCKSAYTGLGALYSEENLDLAIKNFTTALEIDPSDAYTASVLENIKNRKEQERVEKQRQEEEARKAKAKSMGAKVAIAAAIAAIAIAAGFTVYNSQKKSVAPPASPASAHQQSSPAPSNNAQQSQDIFQATHKVVTDDGSNLRLRDAPGFNTSQIGSLEYGSSVQVLETGASAVDSDGNRGNWTRVSTPDGKTGWCFDAYLQLLR